MKQTPSGLLSKVTECRVCHAEGSLQPWFSLGVQPLANNLKELPEETDTYFPLDLLVCKVCSLVTLSHVVNPDHLFSHYLYLSSTSGVFRNHFADLAEQEIVMGRVTKGSLVVDIGSNDGILLEPFQQRGVSVIGVEPATNIAQLANSKNIPTMNEYFTLKTAGEILKNWDYAQLVTMTNVFAHVDDLDEVITGVKALIGKRGRFMIEVPDIMYMLENNAYDLIYHEHLSYFFLKTLEYFFSKHGLAILDVQKVKVHGMSLRVFVGDPSLPVLRTGFHEKIVGQESLALVSPFFWKFSERVEGHRERLLSAIRKIQKRPNPVIIGYGAAAKATVQCNYNHFTRKDIAAIVDDNVLKQGMFVPGTDIPIYSPYDNFTAITNHVYLFAWNYSRSIMASLAAKRYRGNYIIPFPEPQVSRGLYKRMKHTGGI